LGLFIHIPWACSFTFVGPVFLNPDRVPAISLAASLLHYKKANKAHTHTHYTIECSLMMIHKMEIKNVIYSLLCYNIQFEYSRHRPPLKHARAYEIVQVPG